MRLCIRFFLCRKYKTVSEYAEGIRQRFVLQSLLDEPNPNSPANSLAAQLYQENKREYEKRVATVVEQSWLNFQESHTEDPR